jgi:hypothetical protein
MEDIPIEIGVGEGTQKPKSKEGQKELAKEMRVPEIGCKRETKVVKKQERISTTTTKKSYGEREREREREDVKNDALWKSKVRKSGQKLVYANKSRKPFYGPTYYFPWSTKTFFV